MRPRRDAVTRLGALCVALSGAACSPDITQEAQLRDPHGVTVYDENGGVLIAPGPEPKRAVSTAGSTWMNDRSVVVARDDRGALWAGVKPMLGADGNTHVKWPAGQYPVIAEPVIRDETLYLSYPYRAGRSVTTRLSLATPLSNVIRVREVRETSFYAPVVLFGVLLTAGGVATVVSGATHSGLSTVERTAEIALSSLLLLPGLACLGIELNALMTPNTDRLVYEAPRSPSRP